MALLVRKAHELGFDRGTVARSLARDVARIHGASSKIIKNHLVGVLVGIHNVTGGVRLAIERILGRVEGKGNDLAFSLLHLEARKINAPLMHSRRRARLEAQKRNTKLAQRCTEPLCGEHTVGPCREYLVTDENLGLKEGSRCNNHALGTVALAHRRFHTDNAASARVAHRIFLADERGDLRLDQA